MIYILKLIKESVLMALNALVINKLRTFLSLLGITIGIFAIIAGVMFCDHGPAVFAGRSAKGQSLRDSFWNFLCKIDNDFSVKPEPTFPANKSFWSL